ncbi:MAG: MBL fold metallo-hydrolase, partial [Desulfobacterales bacterium]|nr:MBL fold metallo-hydrolase [Desulfobacterales bacterium]
MDIIFLGTGGAWGVPELNCDCLICREMRLKNEKRRRTALLLSGESNLLIDCGPDIASQLSRHEGARIDALLITHEHGDHYMGMDELSSYKRTSPKEAFEPIPVYVTAKSWEVISARFGYLEALGVIRVFLVEPKKTYSFREFEILPFKTNHGAFASGSVGYSIKTKDSRGKQVHLVYTSDFLDLPEFPVEILSPDYLIIQSLWLNEPRVNRPFHMSLQRALEFIKSWKPKRETFLVHIGDSDQIPGDPANQMNKKA